MSLNPIAYAYEADHHCPGCAEERFGPGALGTDNEGNEVGAVFGWDEWYNLDEKCEVMTCGDCRGEITRVHADACTCKVV